MSEDALLGKVLGGYRLETLLGEGGMARVYWGLEPRTRRSAAVKIMEASFRDQKDYRVRFQREAHTVARLHHPHIVELYSYGESDGNIYIVMQYIEGTDLASILHRYQGSGGRMGLEDICRLVYEIGSALDYAHQQGVIHRDVKPSNILVDQQGHATLSDFGLALQIDVGTRGEIFGTPHYIAPEQAISSAGAVPQSDQYSLGIILYEMLAGQLPFDAGSPLDTAVLHITQPPPLLRGLRPDLSPEIESVVLRALEKKPEDRYATCVDLAVELEHARRSTMPASAPQAQMSLAECVVESMVSLPTLPAVKGKKGLLAATVPANSSNAETILSARSIRRRSLRLFFVLLAVALVLSFAIWWFTK